MSQLFETSLPPTVPVTGRFVRVALEQGIDTSAAGLTYAVPPGLEDVQIGDRVVVPLGKGDKRVTGYVIELADQSEYAKTKELIGRDEKGVSLPADLIQLAKWIAGYYCCPIGMVFATMLPAAVKRGTGMVTQAWVKLNDAGRRAAEENDAGRASKGEARQIDEEDDDEGDADPAASSKSKSKRLSKLQRAVLEQAAALAKQNEFWVEMKRLADIAGARSVAPVKQLVDKGLLDFKQTREVQAEWGDREQRTDAPPEGMKLTGAQSRAIERLADSVHQGFSVHLLHGVTGSGKTEVYLRVIEHLLGAGAEARSKAGASIMRGSHAASAIVLVPEIVLTPQTVARFVGRFDSVAVLHSGLSAAQRHEEWRRIRAGQARIVVGARSAIFAPLPNVGVIIVDEEHESSYKQDQLPRYHARDVAIKRGQILGIPVVLGSATPSLESYFNATVEVGAGVSAAGSGAEKPKGSAPAPIVSSPDPRPQTPDPKRPRFHLLKLPERVAGLRLPQVDIVDMNQERRKRYTNTGSAGVHLLSLALENALRQTMKEGGQAILLLNRRGYANYIACPDHRCGWLMNCEFCDATMVYHKDAKLPTGGLVRCHHCEAEQLLPQVCPACSKKVSVFGWGTQRVEEEIFRKFPGLKYLRMDSDVMRTGRDYELTLETFRKREIDLLVGTQMIAKGLDFPNVRLVGVVSADTSLHMPDFRASERTFQLIAQVAGRAGRSEHPGRVIVQTFNPTDAAITLASNHDYDGFAKRELELRQQVGLPPWSRMARIVVRDRDHLACYELVKELAEQLNAINREQGAPVRIRGPMPCPIARVAEFHRQQIELLAPDAAKLQKLLTAARNAKGLRSDARTAVDVDPVSLL